MSLVAKVQAIAREQMLGIANDICRDYKAEVTSRLKHPELSSGEAAGSIHVEKMGETTYRIGAKNKHLFFFEEGNGSGGIPKKGKPKAPMPLKYGTLGTPKGYAMHVSNYKGQHCNVDVAKKYGGG